MSSEAAETAAGAPTSGAPARGTRARRGSYAKGQARRQAIVDEALIVFGRSGYHSGSLREIAKRVGLTPTGLMHHFANKEELVDGMIDRVWTEVEAPSPELPWRDAMRRRAVSLREALLRHRWAVGLMEGRMRPGYANLRQHDAMMGCLRSAGFSFRTTVHVTSLLDAYVYGFALQQKTLPFATPEESGEAAGEKLDATPPELAQQFPHLLEVVVELGRAGYDYDEEFATGLDLLLDGVERLRPEWAVADRR